MTSTLQRSLSLFCLAFLVAACSREDAATAGAAPQAGTDTAPEPALPPIPEEVPSLPPGSMAILIQVTGEPRYADPVPERGYFIELRGNETDATIQVEPGEDVRTMTEKLARRFLADGWTLHLERSDPPKLYLYLPPGEINLNFAGGSGVPGVGISWALTSPPGR